MCDARSDEFHAIEIIISRALLTAYAYRLIGFGVQGWGNSHTLCAESRHLTHQHDPASLFSESPGFLSHVSQSNLVDLKWTGRSLQNKLTSACIVSGTTEKWMGKSQRLSSFKRWGLVYLSPSPLAQVLSLYTRLGHVQSSRSPLVWRSLRSVDPI